MTCEGCGQLYCFTHGTAHPPTESCADFEARNAVSSATRRLLEQDTKPCPKCHALTHKFTGCNHMTCSQCGQDWCWLCGEPIDVSGLFPVHYARANIASPCAGRQFTDAADGDADNEPGVWCVCLFLLFFLPLCLLAALVFLVVSTVTLPCLVISPEYRHTWLRWETLQNIVFGICMCIGSAIVLVPCGFLLVYHSHWQLWLALALLCCFC